ncbi:MAG: hypothetical protein J0L87_03005 [Bacteroidetes bacterium]|nr:hypothetical protein [Bacteroidota bacterium]
MKLHSVALLFSIILLSSCIRERNYDIKTATPVPYAQISKTAAFNDQFASLTLDSINNVLLINLIIKNADKIPFPINDEYKDTLTHTAFNLEFLYNGQIIKSDYCSFKSTLRWTNDTTENKKDLRLTTDTIDLSGGSLFSFKLPYYAFHHIKSGKQKFTLKVYQTLFMDELRLKTDSTYKYLKLYDPKQLFATEISFELNIPKIYKSRLYGYGLQLRNDSIFSPAGMDNTIWNSSYPDIYWSVFYPTDMIYAQTPYQKSTDRYEGNDTFILYHYYKNDSIGIGVYDHDNLSPDDGLGYKVVDLRSMERKYPKRLSFDAIKSMDLKLQQEGAVN